MLHALSLGRVKGHLGPPLFTVQRSRIAVNDDNINHNNDELNATACDVIIPSLVIDIESLITTTRQITRRIMLGPSFFSTSANNDDEVVTIDGIQIMSPRTLPTITIRISEEN